MKMFAALAMFASYITSFGPYTLRDTQHRTLAHIVRVHPAHGVAAPIGATTYPDAFPEFG